ncbi:glycoside hydrolase family 3 protein [Zopfia rhizophila CBS 207.26]|uniref:beta-glucosidase n=1 Tax=Zopfia rhizophila CBS 207.26 TaxID=1314779 RepID=A0A6A6E3K7_9PEZI|nr:glycoside hydrolase family 3 protein [Zopfia rhizophila CBS 207.26]
MWEAHAISRLGICSLKTTDGPAGVPCGISLAATFDLQLAQRVGKLLGFKAKCKRAYVLLVPTMSISRSPFGGRNFENFGEDQYLTGILAAKYIEGVQSEGVGACMKHFVGNDQETRRFNMDEQIDERTLREIYLKPFKMALEARPWTAMTAYPRINGEHVDTSQFLVGGILRREWGYEGLVMSDWSGLNDTVRSILATTDPEMPGPPLLYGQALVEAVQRGSVSEKEHVDPAIERLLHLLSKARLLGDASSSTETNGIAFPKAEAESESDNPEARKLVQDAASEGIVLLKNDGLLPLQPAKLQKLAIIGPNAKYPTTGGTGSAIVNPYYISTPFGAISQLAKKKSPRIRIMYERVIFTHLQPPLIGDCLTVPGTGLPGLQVDFFDSDCFTGDLVATTQWHNSLIYFMSDGDVPQSLRGKVYSYKASGILRPSVTGTYEFSLSSTGKAKLYIDDVLLIDNSNWTDISGNFMNVGSVEKFAFTDLETGKTYKLRIDNLVVPPPTPPHDNTLFHKISGVRVGMLFKHDEDAMFNNAISIAKKADTVILVVGHNNDTEREGSDRTSLSLPKRTDDLIAAVCTANPRVVVVTQSACAIAMPWAAQPAAIVHAWYQGQECGNALANVLFGAVNPSGKLPITFPKRIEDHGSYEWFPGNAERDYAEDGEGILVGYRWFDAHGIEPLWPFRYGLSYTSFEISGVLVEGHVDTQRHKNAIVKLAIANAGAVKGSEVVQIYVSSSTRIKDLGRAAAPKSLAGFSKMEFCLRLDAFAWFDVEGNGGPDSKGRWRVDEGMYTCFVGTSSRHIAAEVSVFV